MGRHHGLLARTEHAPEISVRRWWEPEQSGTSALERMQWPVPDDPPEGSAGAGDEFGCFVGGELFEVDLAIVVDAPDPNPRPEVLGARRDDGAFDYGGEVSGVPQEGPVQALVVLVVEVRSQVNGWG